MCCEALVKMVTSEIFSIADTKEKGQKYRTRTKPFYSVQQWRRNMALRFPMSFLFFDLFFNAAVTFWRAYSFQNLICFSSLFIVFIDYLVSSSPQQRLFDLS